MMNAASRFANTFSTMFVAGLPAIKALGITAKGLSNSYLTDRILSSAEKVEQGFRIGDSLRDIKELPELLLEMTAVGEESGSMEGTLQVIGECFDTEVEYATTRVYILTGDRLEVTRVIDAGTKDIDTAIGEFYHIDSYLAASYREANHDRILDGEVCESV